MKSALESVPKKSRVIEVPRKVKTTPPLQEVLIQWQMPRSRQTIQRAFDPANVEQLAKQFRDTEGIVLDNIRDANQLLDDYNALEQPTVEENLQINT